MAPTSAEQKRIADRQTRRVEQDGDGRAMRLEAISGRNISVYADNGDGESDTLVELITAEAALHLRTFAQSEDTSAVFTRGGGHTDIRMEDRGESIELYSVYSRDVEDQYRCELSREVAMAIGDFAEEVF